MRYSELSEHLRQIRAATTGRHMNGAMRAQEVWSAIEASDKTTVSKIMLSIEPLESPIAGMFARLTVISEEDVDYAHVFVNEGLDKHWKEFVAIKEMMHCYTPASKYQSTPAGVAQLFDELSSDESPFTPRVAADEEGFLAAAEVILPHNVVEAQLNAGQDEEQIAAHHGLHPDVVRLICRFDILHRRKNGGFS